MAIIFGRSRLIAASISSGANTRPHSRLDRSDIGSEPSPDLHLEVTEASEDRHQQLVARRQRGRQACFDAGPRRAVDQQCPLVRGAEHGAVERHHLVHVGGELRVELALQGDRHRPQHARIDVDRSRPHQQARLGIELGKKLGRRGGLGGVILALHALVRLAQKLPPASRVATARSVVSIPTIISHPELWPIFRIAATASSAAPDTTAETAQPRSAPR